MTSLRRIKLTKLNRHLVCPLCNGYFVEATTITECLHTFCKTCILRYLSSSSFCPVCDVQVHKTKPTSGLREDKTLQDVVFKLVPGLFRNEMERRAEFYQEHPEAGGDKTEQSLKERRHFFHVDDEISLSLEFLPPAHAHAHALGLRPLRAPSLYHNRVNIKTEKKDDNDKRKSADGEKIKGVDDEGEENTNANDEEEQKEVEIPIRRYLQCPAAVQIRQLEKFIRIKYGLSAHHRVDIVHGGDCLSPELTLLDVVYMYKWTEDNPLNLQYTVIAPPLPMRKRPRSQGSKIRATCPESSPKRSRTSKGSSPKSKLEENESESNLNSISSTKKEENKSKKHNCIKELEDANEMTTLESSNSLNSSRDEADDAMVIDESVSDSPNAMDVDSEPCPEKETETSKCLSPSLGKRDKELQKSCKQTNLCTSPVSSKTSLPTDKPNTPVVKKSSIESLKALVNNSNYSEFQTKSTPLKSNSSSVVPTSCNSNVESPITQNKLQNQTTKSTPTTTGSETKISNTVATCDSTVAHQVDKKPVVSSASNRSESLDKIGKSDEKCFTGAANSISKSTASDLTFNSVSTTSTVYTNVSNAQSSVNPLCKSESPRISQSNTEILTPNSSSVGVVNVTKEMPVTIPRTSAPLVTSSGNGTSTLSPNSATISRSNTCTVSKFNKMPPVSKTEVVVAGAATAASTFLTSSLKAPLTSSTPSPSSVLVPSTSDNSVTPKLSQQPTVTPKVSQQPIVSPKVSQQPPGKSLISNSYRSSLPGSNGLKINGILSTTRPILDPTKPRLGRPPNSARIAAAAAGRIGPQPILPRGATPREMFSPKTVSGGVKGEGRGRPKSQGVPGLGRGSTNRFISQQPVTSVGKNMSSPKSNNLPGIPKNITTNLPSVVGKDFVKNTDKSTSNLSGSVSKNCNKNILPSNSNNNAVETKGINIPTNSLSNVINSNINKFHKKITCSPEQTVNSSPNNLQKSQIYSSKANLSSQIKASPVPNSSGMKTTKSPNRAKASGSNSSSILSIAQNLANKQRQQISQADAGSTLENVISGTPALSPVASLGAQFNPLTGLPNVPAALVSYMANVANYNTIQNFWLNQVRTHGHTSSLQDPSLKMDSYPMDLSPSNKVSPISDHNSSQGTKVKGPNSSRKSVPLPKATPLQSPQNNMYASPSVGSPKPSKSPSNDAPAIQSSTISPPTSEVTITKLPNTSTESPTTSSCTSSSTKPSHTNTVSITKRPSITSSSSSSTNGVSSQKFGVTRSPSNASVRQIPNPSLLSHQSEVRNSSNKVNKVNQIIPSTVINNNSSNKNNNKSLKVDS